MITRKSLADEIDTYDQSIADLNVGKKDCFDAYRDQMVAAGVAKANIKAEIEAVKAAIRRRRAVAKDAFAVEEKDALVDEIFHEITASPRAPRAHVENIEKIPPHDPVTGEIVSQAKASEDNGSITGGAGAVAGEVSRLASGRTDAATSERTDVTAGETAPYFSPAVPAPADGQGSIPSTDARAAGQGDEPGQCAQSEQAVTPSIAGILRNRPHCQHPGTDRCGGYGVKYCSDCQKLANAAKKSEAA